MTKFVLIDDRVSRQQKQLGGLYSLLKEQEKDDKLTMFGELPEDSDFWDKYEVYAIHRSYLVENSLLDSVKEKLKDRKKYLILYSGGINQNILLDEGRTLIVNSIDFYSSSLLEFINNLSFWERNDINLLTLLYGSSWRLASLLFLKHMLWLYPCGGTWPNNDVLIKYSGLFESLKEHYGEDLPQLKKDFFELSEDEGKVLENKLQEIIKREVINF